MRDLTAVEMGIVSGGLYMGCPPGKVPMVPDDYGQRFGHVDCVTPLSWKGVRDAAMAAALSLEAYAASSGGDKLSAKVVARGVLALEALSFMAGLFSDEENDEEQKKPDEEKKN